MVQRFGFNLSRGIISRFSMLLGSTVILFTFSLFAFSILLFSIGICVTALHIVLPLIATVIFAFLGSKKYFSNYKKPFLLIVLSFFVILTNSISIVSRFYDFSWDGQEYQQKAVIDLSKGWNPVYKELPEQNTFYVKSNNHYPIMPWVNSTAIYKLTGNIEAGKCFNILLIFAAFFLTLSFLLRLERLNFLAATAIAFLAAVNPVCVSQSLSYYIDTQLASLILCIISLLLLELTDAGIIQKVTLALAIAACLNVKFTAVAYLVVICTVFGLIYLFYKKNRTSFAAIVAGAFIGLVVVGFHPYVTNILSHGNPLYPVFGSNDRNVDYLMSNLRPANIEKTNNRFERLFISIFSETSNALSDQEIKLKLPFRFTRNEFEFYKVYSDLRSGAFGPLFALLLLISLGILVLGLVKGNRIMWVAFAFLLLVFASAIINEECWWARYAPQIWLIPVIILTGAAMSFKNKILRNFVYFMVLLGILNVSFIAISYYKCNYDTTIVINSQIRYSKESGRQLYIFCDEKKIDKGFRSNIIRLEANGIEYREVKKLPPVDTWSFPYSNMKCFFADQIKDYDEIEIVSR